MIPQVQKPIEILCFLSCGFWYSSDIMMGMLTTIMNQPFWDVNMCQPWCSHVIQAMLQRMMPPEVLFNRRVGPWSSVFIKNDHRVDMWYMCSIANRFFFIDADIMSIYLYYFLYIYIYLFIPYIYLFHISVLVEVCASGLQSDAVSMSPTMATGSSGIKSWVAADWACGAWCEPCGAPWGCWIWWLRWIRS